MLIKFILFQLVILLPFCAGMVFKKRFSDIRETSRRLIRANLVTIEPIVVLWSVWGLELSGDLAVLPAAGLVLVLAGIPLGFLFASALKLGKERRLTFVMSASLSNHGFTLGGFLCYIFFGERGLGYSFIFISYFMPYVFLFIFPAARALSKHALLGKEPFWRYTFNLQNMPLFAVFFALALRLCGLPRPKVSFPVDLFIMVSVGIYYFSLGINFKAGEMKSLLPEFGYFSLIKFLLLPLATGLALRAVRLDPLAESVIMLQSFMPAAIYSVVVSVLFELEEKLASGLFVLSTIAFMTVVLPVIFFLKPWSWL